MNPASPVSLLGTWQVRRRLTDQVAKAAGTVTGTLTLTPDGADIDWIELGVLRWFDRDIAVSRRYRLRDTGDGWWLLFEDGRPFHPWTPGISLEHPCVADVYRGMISLDEPGHWRMLWEIRGPHKQQRILTRFTRMRGDAHE